MNNQGQWRMNQNTYSTEEQQFYNPSAEDVAMDDGGMEMDGETPKKKTKPWERLGPDGRPIKRKPNPARKNAVFRKALQPKSSIMCLNELQSGLKYVTEPVASIGNVCVSVEVNGQTFRGYGSSKDLAKQAAAEAALVSFVKPPPQKGPDGEPPKPEDDSTPWRTLASFAMYKLFSDWRDGKIGMANTAAQQQGFAGAGSAAPMGFPMMAQQQIPKENPASFNNVTAHLTRNVNPNATPAVQPKQEKAAAQTTPTPKPIRETKLNAEAQQTRHPVMILHQLCPVIKYSSEEGVGAVAGTKSYVVSAIISGQTFTGEAPAIKKAKICLAKTALKALYDIDNVYQGQ